MGIEFFFSSDQLSQSWKLIYDELSFPFEVRFHLDEWLEKWSWDDMKRTDSASYNQEIYRKLIEELDKKIGEKSLDKLKTLQLQTAKAKIVDQFETRPAELVDVLQKCFSHERLLIESTKTDDDRQRTEEDAELLKYREKEKEIRDKIQHLKPRSQRLEVALEQFHNFMQEAVSNIKDHQDAWNLEVAAAKGNDKLTQQANVKIKQLQMQIQTKAAQITEHKKMLAKELVECSRGVSQVLHDSWGLIKHYKLQQKQSVCFLAKPPEGAIDTLNKVCEESGRQLKAYMLYVDKLLGDVNLLHFTTCDEEKQLLEKLKAELFMLFKKHLEEVFIITKQPQNVQKIVQNKSPSLSMCVRFLGGLGLGIEHSLPSVTVRVYAEQRLREAMEAEEPKIEGMCKTVENGNSILMELKRATGHIQANLNNVQLRGVERLEKKMKDDRVTEHKYGMVFYTKVNVCNQIFPLRALSLPIVLTSQTSQNGAAKGTLIWDAAFSKPERRLYDEETSVEWSKVEEVLRAMFRETGRSLEQDQLNYIAAYIFCKGHYSPDEDFSKHQLSKERFMRDKVPGRDFTFWRWIYACKNLIENHVSQEWKDKVIYGFIGRSEAERLLSGHPPGTFLLRFRERKLEDSQRASKCACLALAVVGHDPHTGETKVDHVKDHLTPTDIHKYTLCRVLNSLVDVQTKQPLLQTLYPDTNFQTLVKKYLPDTGDTSIGYNPTRLLIGVQHNSRSDQDDSASEGPLSPMSPMSSTVSEMNALSPTSSMGCEMSHADFGLSEDLQNIHVHPIIEPTDQLENFLTNDGNILMLTPDDFPR